MMGKAKKRLEVLKKRREKLQLQLSGATRQADDPGEPERIRAELQAVEAEMAKLKAE